MSALGLVLTCSRNGLVGIASTSCWDSEQVNLVKTVSWSCASVPGLAHLPSTHVPPATECQLCVRAQLTPLVPTGNYPIS